MRAGQHSEVWLQGALWAPQQLPLGQPPPQQSEGLAHDVPVGPHAEAWQVPPVHTRPAQQSPSSAQVAPRAPQEHAPPRQVRP